MKNKKKLAQYKNVITDKEKVTPILMLCVRTHPPDFYSFFSSTFHAVDTESSIKPTYYRKDYRQ